LTKDDDDKLVAFERLTRDNKHMEGRAVRSMLREPFVEKAPEMADLEEVRQSIRHHVTALLYQAKILEDYARTLRAKSMEVLNSLD
jgi:hypothetical protein